MPPKSRYQRGGGEPKTGLVITLVFFILATIGLGVATYYGFADYEKKDKDVKEAKTALEAQKLAAKYYQFCSWVYSDYIGEKEDIDPQEYATLWEQFEQGKLGAKEANIDKVRNKITKLNKPKEPDDVSWDATKTPKAPKITYEQLVVKFRQDLKALNARVDQAKEEAAGEKRKREEAEKLYADLKEEYKAKFDQVNANQKKDLDKEKTDVRLMQDKIAQLGAANELAEKKVADAEKKALIQANKDKAQLASVRAARDALQTELEAIKSAKAEAPVTARTDWKIIRLDERGQRPYINLGAADRVKPQLTFSIHTLGPDGKLTPEPKGTLEVVNVLGEHMSQTRITSVKDAARTPILVGDVLYNPLWDPNLKKHVAIAGLIDLSGVSRDPELGLDDFFRHLEKQNVIVDAWIEPKMPFAIKGKGITLQTDMLILGESSDFFTDGRERNIDVATKLENSIKEMRRQAKENGVGVQALRKYLESIGYRVPAHLAAPTEVSPLYKGRPDVPPPADKAPPADKGAPADGGDK